MRSDSLLSQLHFLPFHELDEYESRFLDSTFLRSISNDDLNMPVYFLPQSHSCQYMYMEHKSLEESLASLDLFKDTLESLLDAGFSQYLLFKLLSKIEFKGQQSLFVVCEGSPGLTAAELSGFENIKELVDQCFPNGPEMEFSELSIEQLQILTHVGAVNLLFLLGHIPEVTTESPVCPMQTQLPEFPEFPPELYSGEELFQIFNVEKKGRQHTYDKFFREQSPESYKFWVTDRENRVKQWIQGTLKANPSAKMLLVFGASHEFPDLSEGELERYMESNPLLRILGYEKLIENDLQSIEIGFSDSIRPILQTYLRVFWTGLEKNVCNRL